MKYLLILLLASCAVSPVKPKVDCTQVSITEFWGVRLTEIKCKVPVAVFCRAKEDVYGDTISCFKKEILSK